MKEYTRRDWWLCYAKIKKDKIGLDRLLKQMDYNIGLLFDGEESELIKFGATIKEINAINEVKDKLDVDLLWKELKTKNINFVTRDENEYPSKLLQYEDSPQYLFYKGTLPREDKPIVAMVGARACSNYGRIMAKDIGEHLSSSGVQVISGMARGIDTYSQLGALQSKTPTFAVLGCGVDICYPTENIELYEDILNKGGGIISEYWPGTPPEAWHFPMRNRIISGMADKVAVVEAKEKSGSLITVEWALEQGKDIYALPGRVNDELSKGCNRLIKIGAGVMINADDILEGLNYDLNNNISGLAKVVLDENMRIIYQTLEFYPKGIDDILKETKLDFEVVIQGLLELQMQGIIEEVYKNYYSRKK